ncbi:MAG: putative TIM-barrel fold metal-dependent hydrolase [Planctomycetota bacterium]|jgi:predicted TIM-barrel fold metal-dependent hydrolase
MLIDAHNHPNWHGFNAEKILRNMDEQNIDQMWLFSWEVPEDEYSPSYHAVLPPTGRGIPLEDVIAVGREAPDRFVLGYMPHPKRPDAIDRLKAAVEIHGVRIASELKVRLPFDDPDALRLYQFCGEQKLPITIHLDYPLDHGHGMYPRPNWWYGGSMDSFERAIVACPETIFIGHAPGFWAHLSGDDQYDKVAYPDGPIVPGGRVGKMLRQHENLYADLSAGSGLKALQRDASFGRQFLIDFQDRLLFGRDYFDTRLMDFIQEQNLPAVAYDKITYQNAQRLLSTYLS